MSASPAAHAAMPKPIGRFTGERLKIIRPEVYRRVVDLLAEPRAQVPYDHICRLLRVSEHTVKAIEKAQSLPIAERKEKLLAKALRIADKAADRIEDQLDGATITQATIAFGVATEKALLLNSDPMMMQGSHSIGPAIDLFAELAAVRAAIVASMKANPLGVSPPPLLLESEATQTGH